VSEREGGDDGDEREPVAVVEFVRSP